MASFSTFEGSDKDGERLMGLNKQARLRNRKLNHNGHMALNVWSCILHVQLISCMRDYDNTHVTMPEYHGRRSTDQNRIFRVSICIATCSF